MRKKAIYLLLAMCCTISLIGCGKKKDNNLKEKDASGDEKVTLKLFHNWINKDEAPYFEDIAKEFEKSHPNVHIKIENVGDPDYKSKLKVMLGANDAPDIFFSWSGEFAYKFARANKAIDLSKYYEEDTKWKESFVQASLVPFEYNEDIYGVPVRIDCKLMAYNKELFDKYNLKVPTTFDEFLNIDSLDSFIVEYDKSRTLILDGSYKVNQDNNPYNPSGVKLTIDKLIQQEVEKIMDKHKLNGAVIVADTDTSGILALASRPNFDQNDIQSYLNDDSMALYNKAIQVAYPPGSIFKIIVLLTALEVDPTVIEDQYYCNGYEEINGVRINCGGKHGYLTLEEAFAKSCNSVFIQLAQAIGSKNIIDMSKTLGFGQKLNIGLLEETDGNLPIGNELLGPAVGNIAIGQGKIEVTPLQITNMMMTLVNDGVNRPLNLIRGITNDVGYIPKKYNLQDEKSLISVESSQLLMKMMREVVKSGTGKYIELEDIGGCGGKTGSAEGILNQEKTIYGWFSGFYPYKNPRYVVTVIIEDADSGSRTAAPIFEEIIREIYKL